MGIGYNTRREMKQYREMLLPRGPQNKLSRDDGRKCRLNYSNVGSIKPHSNTKELDQKVN
jgi:hypothetical protein